MRSQTEMRTRSWKQKEGNPSEVAADLAELYSTVLWKGKLVSNKTGHSAEISRQSLKVQLGSTSLFIAKCERREMKKQ